MPVRHAKTVEGGQQARTDLREYLIPMVKSLETEAILEMTLVETSKGAESGREIGAYEIGFDEDAAKNTILEMVRDAERDAMEMMKSGRIKYSAKIDGKRGSLVFALEVYSNNGEDEDDEDDDNVDDLEAPSKRGVLQMAMRHAELSNKEMRFASKGTRELLKDTRQELQAARIENRELREQIRKGFRLEQELHNADHARRLDWRKNEKAEERKDKFVGGIEKLLPVVGGHIMGIDPKMMASMMQPESRQPSAVSPQPGDPTRGPRTEDEADIDALMGSLTREQGEELAKVFTQEQVILLMRLHARSTDRAERDKARAAESGQAKTNGTSGSAYGGTTS